MKLLVKKGKTSKIIHIFIQDSSSTTGAGLTGLTNASTGLTCYRARTDDGNAGGTQLVLAAGTRGTWSSGGFVEKDATNLPGVYELGLDNAGLATGADDVLYMLKGATNMAPLPLEIQLVDFDPQDSVRLGLTALPNAAANGVGGLPVLDANSLVDVDIKRWLATAVTAATAGIPDVNTKNYNNVAAATDANNLPKVDLEDVGGAALATHAAGMVPADLRDIVGAAVATGTAQLGVNVVTNGDKTGYSLTQAFPANFATLAIDSGGNVSMTSNVKKNTAQTAFMFLMTDATTHAPKTGLVVTATRSIDGAAFAACANAVSEVSGGWYTIALAATDVNGNDIALRFTATGADDCDIKFKTQP